jgi:archaellum component FlaF (FlaF/FlaG flagellin family)
MENVLFSLFSAILLIISTLIMVTTSLRSVNVISESFQAMEQQAVEIRNTAIDLEFIEYSSSLIKIKVLNVGQTDLKQFDQWNVLVQRPDGSATEMTYVPATQPASNQWSVQGIFLSNNNPEVFDPGIFNPDEVMIILININPVLSPGQAVRVTAATANGVTAQCMVSVE